LPPGDSQGLRSRLASAAVHRQRIAVDRRLSGSGRLAKAAGIITNARSKGWLEPQTRSDPAVREFVEWMRQYNPQASLRDQNNVAGYERAAALVEVLKKCGDNLTRANVMQQAAHLDIELGMLRPGIRVRPRLPAINRSISCS
jgi:erythromycin esterase-like protein